jgi:hypothetical protein
MNTYIPTYQTLTNFGSIPRSIVLARTLASYAWCACTFYILIGAIIICSRYRPEWQSRPNTIKLIAYIYSAILVLNSLFMIGGSLTISKYTNYLEKTQYSPGIIIHLQTSTIVENIQIVNITNDIYQYTQDIQNLIQCYNFDKCVSLIQSSVLFIVRSRTFAQTYASNTTFDSFSGSLVYFPIWDLSNFISLDEHKQSAESITFTGPVLLLIWILTPILILLIILIIVIVQNCHCRVINRNQSNIQMVPITIRVAEHIDF